MTVSWMCSGAKAEETPATITDDRVNVRGQPSLIGEVITQLNKGETVLVLEEIPVEKPKPHEPAKWAKIRIPANTPVWISAAYVDAATKTITATRLNLRAGPGENYSVIGRLERGDTIKEIRTVDGWMEIETPDKAYAFVAAEFVAKGALPSTSPATAAASDAATPGDSATPSDAVPVTPSPEAPALVSDVTTPEAPETESPVAGTDPEAGAPTPVLEPVTITPPEALPSDPLVPVPDLTPVPLPAEGLPAQPDTEPSSQSEAGAPVPADAGPKRIVRREGVVRTALSIKAPTWFELVSPDSRRVINYLHSDDTTLNLKDYKGRKIVVSGQEAVDPRWPKTPVLLIETLNIAP